MLERDTGYLSGRSLYFYLQHLDTVARRLARVDQNDPMLGVNGRIDRASKLAELSPRKVKETDE